VLIFERTWCHNKSVGLLTIFSGGNIVNPPTDTLWYYEFNGQPKGPLTLEQVLATGQVEGQTRVWRAGYVDWIAASQVMEFASLFQPAAAGNPIPQAVLKPIISPPPLTARSEFPTQSVVVPGGPSGAVAAQHNVDAQAVAQYHPPGPGGLASSVVNPGIKGVGSGRSVQQTSRSSNHGGSRTVQVGLRPPGKSIRQRKKKKEKGANSIKEMIFVILGSALAFPIAQIILWQLGQDPLKLAPKFRDAGFPEYMLVDPVEKD
jgi:hypothetical protein